MQPDGTTSAGVPMKGATHVMPVAFCAGAMLVLDLAFAGAGRAAFQSAEVVWSTSTNGWPEQLWVYAVVPQDFSEAVVSNLMVLTGFATNDQATPPGILGSIDPKAVYFGRSWSKHLTVSASLGFIEYHDEGAQASMTSSENGVPEPAVGVPGQEQTRQ